MRVSEAGLDPIMFSKEPKESDESKIKEKLSALKQELNDLKKKKDEELSREDKKRIKELEKQVPKLLLKNLFLD